jgi:sugar/nucleoside kinase (ribokinase family)
MSDLSVVIAGHLCIDHNRSERATYTGWGSAALYMAQVFREQYGSQVTVLANYGPDILPYLPSVTLMPDVPTEDHTLVYENDSSVAGKRVQHCYNLDAADPLELTDERKQLLASADIVVLAVLLANYDAAHVRELLASCKPSALTILCPQGYFRHVDAAGLVSPRTFAEADDIVKEFDLVVYSEEDYPDAFTAGQAWKRTAPHTQIVVTQGSKGASIVHADQIELIPTIPIPPEEIVDSVGCGDTFAAAVAKVYHETGDLPAAVAAAHQVAAHKLRTVQGVNIA